MLDAQRIFIAGSSELPGEIVPLAQELARRLMTETSYVMVTGGLESKGQGKPAALDGVLLRAASAALGGVSEALQERILTMLPESTTNDWQDGSRVQIGKVFCVAHADRRARRYSMVLSSDVVVGVCGAQATRESLDLAYIAGKPVLPLPATGGSSREAWQQYRPELVSRFNATPEECEALEDAQRPERVISTCIKLVRRVLRPRCFVAMPFAEHPVPTAFEAIRASTEKLGYQVIRIDQEPLPGSIIDAIWQAIHHVDVVIADLTAHRPSVYYELGIAHALRKPTLLVVFSRDGTVPTGIPFDVMMHTILPYGTDATLRSQIQNHLPSLRRDSAR